MNNIEKIKLKKEAWGITHTDISKKSKISASAVSILLYHNEEWIERIDKVIDQIIVERKKVLDKLEQD